MSWNLVTFAHGSKSFYDAQLFISSFLEKYEVKSFKYTEDDLKNSDFYEQHKNYLLEGNKYGWCSWKPFFVLEAMKNLEEGDKIVLCDVNDVIHPDIFTYVDEVMGDDPSLFILGHDLQRKQTKRDRLQFVKEQILT